MIQVDPQFDQRAVSRNSKNSLNFMIWECNVRYILYSGNKAEKDYLM